MPPDGLLVVVVQAVWVAVKRRQQSRNWLDFILLGVLICWLAFCILSLETQDSDDDASPGWILRIAGNEWFGLSYPHQLVT